MLCRYTTAWPMWVALLGAAVAPACVMPEQRAPVVSAPSTPLDPSCEGAPEAPAAITLTAGATADDIEAAFSMLSPGDVLRLDGVELDAPLGAFPSGDEGAPVVVDARGSTFRGTWDLSDVHDLTILGALLLSDGAAPWLFAEGGVQRVAFEGNAFDITCLFCGDHFTGAELSESEGVRFCGNRFGWWWGDTLTFVPAGAVALVGNDFVHAASDHGVIVYTGRQLVVRGNVFRNPFDRVIHVASSEPEVWSGRALIEHNVFFDSDWDRERPRPGAASDIANDGGGANEVVRLIGEGHVFRDNLLLSNRRGNDADCHAALTMSTWAHPPYRNERNQHTKVYSNVFLDNQTSAVSVADGLDSDGNADNRVAFNVFSEQTRGALAVCADAISEDDVRFTDNLTGGDGVQLADGELRTIADVEVSRPAQFSGNRAGAPRFTDDDAARRARAAANDGALTFAERDALFAAFAAPADEGGASALTALTADASGTVLAVEDAYWFSAGHGLVEGDLIVVGDVPTRVRAVSDRFTLEVEEAVTAPAGTTVGLAAMNRRVGVFAP
jgi:hypothetical protein